MKISKQIIYRKKLVINWLTGVSDVPLLLVSISTEGLSSQSAVNITWQQLRKLKGFVSVEMRQQLFP